MEKIIIECPFCAEEIEKGLEICPQCKEPLGENAKRTKYTNQGRSKRKKSTKEKIWFIIGAIVLIAGTVFWKSDLPDKFINNVWDRIFSDSEETVKAKSDDFSSFIQKFVSDKNYQLEHIKFPLGAISKNEWEFLDSNFFFEGVKSIEGTKFSGQFLKESNTEYLYYLSFYESDLIYEITFVKIKGKWILTEFTNDLEFDDED